MDTDERTIWIDPCPDTVLRLHALDGAPIREVAMKSEDGGYRLYVNGVPMAFIRTAFKAARASAR